MNLVFVLVLVHSGPWGKPFAATKIKTKARSVGPLKYCHISWFGRNPKNSSMGPDRELALAFVRHVNATGVPVPVPVEWSNFFENSSGKIVKEESYVPRLFSQRTCDFYAASMTITPWRMNKISIVPFHAGRILIVVKTGRANEFKSIADLAGKVTFVTPNTSLSNTIEDLNKNFSKEQQIKINFKPLGGSDVELKNENADFIALDSSQAFQLLKESPKSYAIAFAVGENLSIGWGFPKERGELISKFSQFIESEKSKDDSDLNKIFRKYYGLSLKEYESVVQYGQKHGR